MEDLMIRHCGGCEKIQVLVLGQDDCYYCTGCEPVWAHNIIIRAGLDAAYREMAFKLPAARKDYEMARAKEFDKEE